jgi:hypothetical protein
MDRFLYPKNTEKQFSFIFANPAPLKAELVRFAEHPVFVQVPDSAWHSKNHVAHFRIEIDNVIV